MHLKDYLKKMNISQNSLAQKIYVKRNTITNYCNNKRIPKLLILKKIIEVTGGLVSFEDFGLIKPKSTHTQVVNMIDDFFRLSGETYLHFCVLLKISKTTFYRKMEEGFNKDEIDTIKVYIQEKRKDFYQTNKLYNEIQDLLEYKQISFKWMALCLSYNYDTLKRRYHNKTLQKIELKKIINEYKKQKHEMELSYESKAKYIK